MLKRIRRILILTICLGVANTAIAQVAGDDPQEIKGGTIIYEAIDKFDLSYFKDADPKVKEWLAGMPKGVKSAKVLYFNNNYSLYEEDNTAPATVVDKKVLVMRSKMPYITAPRPELKKIYIDWDKGLMSKQQELMTRYFIIEEELMVWDWKPGTDQTKILGYLCMSAKNTSGDKIITAWFTPQIQTKAGPGLYNGLPGLILAVDINGENIFLATELDLTPPDEIVFKKTTEGRKMKSEAFQKLVDEKMEQFRAERASQKRKENNDKSGY